MDGRFGEAAAELEILARTAPDAISAARATELAWLARQRSMERPALRPAEAPATLEKLEDKRTIDELAILYTDAAVWGTGFGVTVGLSVHDPTPAWYFMPAIGMSLAGVGAVASLDLTGSRRLRYGVPHSVTAGLYTGLEAGFFAAMTWNGFSSRPPSTGAFAGMMWGSATAGALAGGLIGNGVGTTPGRASMVQSGAMWTGMVSTMTAVGACPNSGNCVDKAPWVVGLSGATLGAVGGGFLGSAISPSIARVRFMDLGAFGGGLVFGGVYASIASTRGFDLRAFSLLTAAGTTVGLGAVGAATNRMERDEPRRRDASAWGSAQPTLIAVPSGAAIGVAGVLRSMAEARRLAADARSLGREGLPHAGEEPVRGACRVLRIARQIVA